jgi:4-hydroxy-tetrahydrodipicolinate synthase
VPSRTGSKIDVETSIQLAKNYENIVAIKEASGDLALFTELVAKRPDGFMVYSGDDFLSPSANLLGADGCISVIANVIPAEFSALMDASLNGNVAEVNKLFYQYRELMDLMFIESNPIPVKTALAEQGLIKEVFRSPMCDMDEANKEKLVNELRKLKVI